MYSSTFDKSTCDMTCTCHVATATRQFYIRAQHMQWFMLFAKDLKKVYTSELSFHHNKVTLSWVVNVT